MPKFLACRNYVAGNYPSKYSKLDEKINLFI